MFPIQTNIHSYHHYTQHLDLFWFVCVSCVSVSFLCLCDSGAFGLKFGQKAPTGSWFQQLNRTTKAMYICHSQRI